MQHLKYFFSFIKKYKKQYILGLFALLFTDIFSLFTPKISGFAIDVLKNIISKSGLKVSFYLNKLNNFLQPKVNFLMHHKPLLLIIYAGIAIILVNLIAGVFRFFWRFFISKTSFLVDYDIRNAYYRKILSLPMDFFSRYSTGEIMARATNDLNAVRMMAGPGFLAFFDPLFVGIISILNMIIINPHLTLMALLPLPFIAILVYIFQKIIFKYFKVVQKNFSLLTNFAQNTFNGIKIIKTYTQENGISEKFGEHSNNYRKSYMNLVKIESLFHPVILIFSSISLVIILYFGGKNVILGKLSLGNFYAFTRYLISLVWPMIAIGWVISIWSRGLASMSRIMSVMDETNNIVETSSGKNIKELNSIEFKHVYFKYPKSNFYVLKDLSFKINKGEKIAFVGKIGSGKSSIIELILRLYDVDKGEILINGENIKKFNVHHLRELIGYVPQESFLFSESLKDNLVLSKNFDEHKLDSVIEMAGLYETIKEFKDGLDTVVGERGVTLSGGQRQRVTIARALYKEPQLIIFDDSFSSIDSDIERKILKKIDGELRGKTQLFIAHRISTIQHVDKIFVLKKGSIVESGDFNTLLKLRGEFFKIYESQKLEE